MKNIKIIAVFIAVLVALSVVICACGDNKNNSGNETTAGGNEVTTSKGNSNNGTTEDPEETAIGGYVEPEAITFVEVTIEE